MHEVRLFSFDTPLKSQNYAILKYETQVFQKKSSKSKKLLFHFLAVSCFKKYSENKNDHIYKLECAFKKFLFIQTYSNGARAL